MKIQPKYKRSGWRGESYRHYLAAKGIKTRYDASKFAQAFGGGIQFAQDARAQRIKEDLSADRQLTPSLVQTEMLKQEIDRPLSAEEEQALKQQMEGLSGGSFDTSKLWSIWTPEIGQMYANRMNAKMRELSARAEQIEEQTGIKNHQKARELRNELESIKLQSQRQKSAMQKAIAEGTARGLSSFDKRLLATQVESAYPQLAGRLKRQETMDKKRQQKESRGSL